jgi:four helix bundle protein
MALITRFEDIQAWQEARKLVTMIYKLTHSGALSKDFGLHDQIHRAAVSSTLATDASAGVINMAEGFDCESKAEFARFLGIARRSALRCV